VAPVVATLIVFALLLGAVCVATLARAEESNLAELVKDAQERAKQVEIKATPPAWQDDARVREAADTARAKGREALEAMLAKRTAPPQSTPIGEGRDAGERKDAARPAKLPGRLVVALSSSMPETQLREYFRQLDGVPEAIVVLRGFIGGARTVQPTGQWIERIRRTRADCVECAHFRVETVVDPLTYRNLNITRVPAFAYLPDVETLSHCDEDDWGRAEVVYGATSVRAAMETLARHDARVPTELIRRLGGV
jgi:type-F conjugative transfer system pilin assembly protein TrbC